MIDLGKIKSTDVPIAIFVGKQDHVSTLKNALRIKKEIGREDVRLDMFDFFNHASFHIG